MKDAVQKLNREARAMKHHDRESVVVKNKLLIRRLAKRAKSKDDLLDMAAALTALADNVTILSPLSTRSAEWNKDTSSKRSRHLHMALTGEIVKTDALLFVDNKGNESHMWKVKVDNDKFISGTLRANGDELAITSPILIDVIVFEYSDIARKKRKKGGAYKSYIIKNKSQLDAVFVHYKKPF